MRVSLFTSAELIERYHELLCANWDVGSVDAAFSLVREQFKASGIAFVFDWEQPVKSKSISTYAITPQMSKHLIEYLNALNIQLVQAHDKIPGRKSQVQNDLARKAIECAAFLHLRRDQGLGLSGEIGFLRDVQSLLFNACVLFLLPELKKHRMDAERDNLLNVLYAHAMLDWADDPAHENQLKSTLYDYLGQHQEKERFLLAAFYSTQVSDHDFLTKAQALWFEIMDKKDFDRAFEFLLNLHRSALPEQLNEIREMLNTTIQLMPVKYRKSA